MPDQTDPSRNVIREQTQRHYKCPHCSMPVPPFPQPVGQPQEPTTGDIFICGSCGTPSRYILNGLQILDDVDWAQFTKPELVDIQRAQKILLYKKHGIDQGL